MTGTDLVQCDVPRRRAQVRARHRAGIDAVEAEDDGRTLTVTFLGKAPRGIDRHHVRIDGGRRITGIQVVKVTLDEAEDPEVDDKLRVTVDRTGDRSTYRLSIVERGPHGRPGTRPFPGFDPRYASAEFSFHPQCPSDVDCVPQPEVPPEPVPAPVIDYTARDYASLRRALLDRMTLTVPRWVERHAPDLAVTLVELLAYTGDQLSYFQDAVATEAYLDTARRRVSVRRHVRLIDYAMHDGCNSRAFVTVHTDRQLTLSHGQYRFVAADAGAPAPRDQPELPPVISDEQLTQLSGGVLAEVFEPLDTRDVTWYPAHNTIRFWTWGDTGCSLPAGATSATLRDTWVAGGADPGDETDMADESHPRPRGRLLKLAPGDLLAIEEVLGPQTGAAADADPRHRQVVRVVSVTPGVDDLYDQPVVEVTWAAEDALRFPVRISARGGPDCADLCDVSVVHGNVVLVDHGRGRTWCVGEPETIPVPPDAVATPSCARPEFGCGDRVEPGPVLSAIQQLLAAAQDGRPLTQDDLIPLVPLVGQPALDRAGLAADDPAPTQALALQALLAQISYPSIVTRFGPVLRDAPVTQHNPYPSAELVALSQARLLDAIPGRARGRVTEIWHRAGNELDAQLRAELTLLFGPAAIERVRLTEHPAQGLAQLLARFDELLAGKLTRLGLLAALARDGNVLGSPVVWEIQQTWGERYATGLDPADPALAGPASAVAVQDPRTALPAVRLVGTDAQGQPAGTWLPRRDLLASGPRDRDVVGEVGDDGRLALRFGGSPHGVAPPPGGRLAAYYRVGNGTAGNVGAEAVNHLVLCAGVSADGVTGVRNPLPATGGTDPEPLAVVRQMAPLALHRTRLRAVTAADYADLAGQVPGVQRAAAQLRWTGAGTEVHVAVDPLGSENASDALLTVVAQALRAYRRIGHEVVVGPAQLVPLDVALRVLVDDGYDRGHVVTALRTVLGAGRLPGGGLGFFHPDALSFGEPVRVSRLVATAAAVPGVLSAEVTRLRPLFRPDGGALAAGLLRLGSLEIAECDNLVDQPEHGRLAILAEGGR